ncbi:MAG: helix-turn-helix transcriptional regulator [Bacteroidales bacterium]|nr:helix-turn-helix transcriptional regulator [Bacteroidales bacterium]
MKETEVYDISAELERELGPIGSEKRAKENERAWEEYNAKILLDTRLSAKMTQEELAQRIGASKGYVSKVERGIIVPTIATFYRMVSAMGKRVELV